MVRVGYRRKNTDRGQNRKPPREAYLDLRDMVPTIASRNVSKVVVIQKAVDYISYLHRKLAEELQDPKERPVTEEELRATLRQILPAKYLTEPRQLFVQKEPTCCYHPKLTCPKHNRQDLY